MKGTKVMERANRLTVTEIGGRYRGTFYRTHKDLVHIFSDSVEWKADDKANNTAKRESYREWLIANAEQYGVIWSPELQKQAWERKYNRYMTDGEVGEDAITLTQDRIQEVANKGKYQMELCDITLVSVTAKESTLSYVEDGKYIKDGAWCVADIELSIRVEICEQIMEVPFNVEMVSGQIKKTKITIADWNEKIGKELELNGIDYYSYWGDKAQEEKDTKTA